MANSIHAWGNANDCTKYKLDTDILLQIGVLNQGANILAQQFPQEPKYCDSLPMSYRAETAVFRGEESPSTQ